MPDLNSLPPSTRSQQASPSTSITPSSPANAMSSPSPQPPSPSLPSLSRPASNSLQAAASLNAGLQHHEPAAVSRRSSGSLSRQATTSSNHTRRLSQVRASLQLNDPFHPAPGEMVAPHVHNPSSISRRSSTHASASEGGGIPHHQRNPSLGEIHQEMEAEQEASVNRLLHQIRDQQAQIRQLQLDQPGVIVEEEGPGASDTAAATEVAFFQAETSLLTRENQMLRHRVRELERQLEALQAPKEEIAGSS